MHNQRIYLRGKVIYYFISNSDIGCKIKTKYLIVNYKIALKLLKLNICQCFPYYKITATDKNKIIRIRFI